MPGLYGDGTYGDGTYGGAPLEAPAIFSVQRAVYTLEAAWNAYNAGIFTFDFSTFDGLDTLGVSPFDIRFTGPNDDLSQFFAGGNVIRGRNNTRDVIYQGGANLDVRDRAGLLNPENAASPLYGQLEDRLHPIRLRGMVAGITYGIFYGWIRRSAWQPNGRKGTARLECVDLFWWLERASPIIAATSPTTTGAAIGKILDSIDWIDPSSRSLDTGDAIPGFSADGTKTGLQLIQELLEAERGAFYIDGDGVATYRDRVARVTMTSAATLIDTMTNLSPGVDFESVRSRVTVKRSQNGYTATATDDPARRKVGLADETIETPYLSSDTNAEDLAAFMLTQLKTPREPVYDMTIDNRTSDLLTQLLARDLVDRITVAGDRADVAGDYHIDQIEHAINGDTGRHTCKWLLSRETTFHPFLFDVSLFDGTDSFIY